MTRTDASVERHWSLVVPWERHLTSYNVAPTQAVPVVVRGDAGRVGAFMRWGLVPYWAKGEPPQYATINARVETLQTAATYRGPWARAQRCILPVLGFYEWKPVGGRKQPYFIRFAGGEPFGLAGLWDKSTKPGQQPVHSCTVVTVPANELVASIHAKGRMPAIVTPETADAWLEGSPESASRTLEPFPAESLEAYPVSARVNTPRNDDPELVEPIEAT